MKTEIKFISIGSQVIATLYYHKDYKYTLIRTAGAPTVPERKSLAHLAVAEEKKTNIIIPDYIGFGRSSGIFNLKNCVKTVVDCIDFANGRLKGKELIDGKDIKLNSKKVLVVGSSFGGGVVPLIRKFYPNIKDLKYVGLLYPVTDWEKLGNNEFGPEEDMDKFDKLMTNVYFNIYNGYEKSEFYQFVRKNKEYLKKYNPIDNTNLLKDSTVFIAHGNKDNTINWERSRDYYNKLNSEGTKTYFNLFRNSGHSYDSIQKKGLSWMIDQIKK